MFVIAGLLLGAVWGAYLARRRKGTGLDVAQYAGVYAIAFAILGLFVTVFVDRMF
jgi:uncharacterized membrane protein (UPF0136 family)